jgi:hypothetical protein
VDRLPPAIYRMPAAVSPPRTDQPQGPSSHKRYGREIRGIQYRLSSIVLACPDRRETTVDERLRFVDMTTRTAILRAHESDRVTIDESIATRSAVLWNRDQ